MKGLLIFAVWCGVAAATDELKFDQAKDHEVLHVATALDHLTVLEFGEPVALAAAGSAAFQIERHEDKVFIKPLKAGASTDLFVWTVSRRFMYELEPPGEVKNMNFAVDNRIPVSKSAPDVNQRLDDIADIMLARVFLGAERIDSRGVKDDKGRVTVRIEHIFCSKDSLYIHYSVRNLGQRPYRVLTPNVQRLFPVRSDVSLPVLRYTQLNESLRRRLGKTKWSELPVATAAIQKEDIGPGEAAHGVIVIRRPVEDPTVLLLMFGSDGNHRIQATVVL